MEHYVTCRRAHSSAAKGLRLKLWQGHSPACRVVSVQLTDTPLRGPKRGSQRSLQPYSYNTNWHIIKIPFCFHLMKVNTIPPIATKKLGVISYSRKSYSQKVKRLKNTGKWLKDTGPICSIENFNSIKLNDSHRKG